MFPPVRSVLIVLLCSAVAAAPAQTPAAAEKTLDEKVKAFAEAKAKADERAAKAFAQMVATMKTGQQIKEATRKELVGKAETAHSEFTRSWKWPGDPALKLTYGELKYNEDLWKAFEPVAEAYEKAMKAHQQAKDGDAVNRLLAAKARLVELNFPARGGFTANTTWDGRRPELAKKGKVVNESLRLEVKSVKGATVEGVLHVNREGRSNPVYQVTGTVEGNRLQFVSAKQVEGRVPGTEAFTGYVSNGRLFLTDKEGREAVLEQVPGPKKK